MPTVNLIGGIYPAPSSGSGADPNASSIILETYGPCANLRGIGAISSIGSDVTANLTNNSLDFNSGSGYNNGINYGTNANYALGSSWTVEAKVNFASTVPSGPCAFLCKGTAGISGSGNEYNFGYWTLNSGFFYSFAKILGNGQTYMYYATFSGQPSISANTDYYVVFLNNAGTISLYINGTSYSNTANQGSTTNVSSTSNPLYLGGDGGRSASTNGNTMRLKAVRLTNAARTISTAYYPLY